MKKLLMALATWLLWQAAAVAGTAVIDFENFAVGAQFGGGYYTQATSYEEKGFIFTSNYVSYPTWDNSPRFFSTAPTAASPWIYSGSSAVFIGQDTASPTISRPDGASFDFNSITLTPIAYFSYAMAPRHINFTGQRSDGSYISESILFIPSDGNLTQQFSFQNMTDVKSVTWYDAGSGSQFDNIAVSGGSIALVPEPETYAMLLAGLGMIGAVRCRRLTRRV